MRILYIPKPISTITTIHFGLLYNWWAATDARGIANTGWSLPSDSTYDTLNTYLSTNQGGKLKESGLTYWKTPNSGATNEVGFNGRASGDRDSVGNFTDGIISTNKRVLQLRTSNNYDTNNAGGYQLIYSNALLSNFKPPFPKPKKQGMSIRLFRSATTPELSLSDGAITATYTGNDGKVYRCCKIGTQVWIADNLAETKYANGDTITEVTDATAWAALTTGALCAYNNDWSNV